MDGYFLSFFVTHLINFLLSLQRLLKITIKSIPVRIPFLSAACIGFGVWAASFVQNDVFRSGAYLLILGSLLFLSGILRFEDIRWAKSLIYKK